MVVELQENEADNFEERLQNSTPTLVEFWSTWCAPCAKLKPVMEEISRYYGNRVNFFRINIETHEIIAKKFAVKGIPALMLFKDGKILATKVGGNLDKIVITTFLDGYL